MTVNHSLVTAWLERVERLAADLPPGARSELLADLQEHIDAALPADADGAQVGAVLERLGDPADVVTAARADGQDLAWSAPPQGAETPTAPEGLLAPEVVALAALVLAGLAVILFWPLAILLWVLGIAIVAVSGRWRGGEVLAMVLLPIAWALPGLSMVVSVGSTTSCVADSTGMQECTEQAGAGGPWILAAAVIVLGLIILGTRWLARAPRGRPVRR